MTGEARYQIVQDDSGRWIITNSHDPALAWCGQHWVDVEQAARVIRFADRAAAESYASRSIRR